MKKIVDIKTGQKKVIFQTYELNGALECPECKRKLKDYDVGLLNKQDKITCTKCGAKLKK